MRVILVIAMALAATPSLAKAVAQGAVTVAPDGALEIAGAPCAALVAGADYVAGVDAEGHAVAPADLAHAPPPVTADTIPVEIGANLAGQFGIPPTGGAYRAKAILGYVTVRDGVTYFNGAPLAAEASAALAAACRAAPQ
jgi:hypothetical protein